MQTIEAERETHAEAVSTSASQMTDLKDQVNQLNERLVIEMQKRERLVEQIERFPPERMKMLEVQNEKLEGMLSSMQEELTALKKREQEAKEKYDIQRQRALGEMQVRHREEMKKIKAAAKRDKSTAVAERDEAARLEIDRLKSEHNVALKQLKDESEETIFALTEIHNERLQEAENLKMQALGVMEANNKKQLKELMKELQRTRLNTTEHLNATKVAHMKVIAEMESSHRDTVRSLQLQLFRLRKK